MSWQTTKWVIGIEMPSTDKLVISALAYHADKNGNECKPGMTLLMRETGLTDRAIQNSIRRLIRWGLVIPINRNGGKGKLAVYRIPIENPEPQTPFLRQTPNLATLNPEPHDINPEPHDIPIEEGTTIETPEEPSFTVEQVQPAFSDTFTRRLERAPNKVGTLGDIFLEAMPPAQPLDAKAKKTFYGRIAAVYRGVGNRPDIVLSLVRETYKAQPRGDPVDYLQAAAKEYGQRNRPRRGPARHDATLDELKEAARRHREQTGDT